MSVIVRDDGFHADDYQGNSAVEIASDTAPADLPDVTSAGCVTIAFPSFSDGRGFTLARHLRDRGFTGRLRAKGHVIADQYAMARRAGFDEVEISDELAKRQPAAQWQARADWQAHDYQSRMRG
ncbi:MAG: DUF934 domain-containing protein [Albidovulum sp.]